MNKISILAQFLDTNFQDCSGQKKFQFLIGFVSSFDGLANYFPMVFFWL
jgi:hypothetical protein